jgi:opacity protein-like surface antigen
MMCRQWFMTLTVSAVALLSSAGASSVAQDPRPDDEQQVGQEVFDELRLKGESSQRPPSTTSWRSLPPP